MSPRRRCRRRCVARHADARAVVVLLRDGRAVGSWPLAYPDHPDLEGADGLARLQLAARRVGLRIELRPSRRGDGGGELLELLDLVGLLEVLGEAERGEEAGVEEVVVADDPVA